jgi:hypothetical protein
MRFIALPLFLVLTLFATTAGSGSQRASSDLPDIDTSRGFLEMCTAVDKNLEGKWAQEDIYQAGYCLGWIAGLTNGIHVAEAVHRLGDKKIFCPPAGNTYGQMIHIIKKFIADHPEKEHLPTGIIAGSALAEAFPCKENK